MKNISMEVSKNILSIKVDLSKTFGPSGSGKSIVIASTEGNPEIEGANGIYAGVNVYRKK